MEELRLYYFWLFYFKYSFVQCETVYNTVYDDKCTVVTEQKCETSYETVYEQECHTVTDTKYVKECETKVRFTIFFRINQPGLI